MYVPMYLSISIIGFKANSISCRYDLMYYTEINSTEWSTVKLLLIPFMPVANHCALASVKVEKKQFIVLCRSTQTWSL